jgi:hypothetical protein
MNTSLEAMLKEALAYQAESFACDEPVDGADLVEWFAEWRGRAQVLLDDREVSAALVESRTTPVCSECGSENVCADAAARWDADAQAWEVVNIFDKGHSCDHCEDGDIRLDWEEEVRGRDS